MEIDIPDFPYTVFCFFCHLFLCLFTYFKPEFNVFVPHIVLLYLGKEERF